MKHRFVLGLLMVLILAGLGLQPAQAQEPIQIHTQEIENNFPVELLFHIDVESQESQITRIKLAYQIQGAISLTKDPLEFEPAQRVQASYRWYTEFKTVPPGAPILYHWEIKDKAGNTLTTETQVYYYDDVRFDWQTLADEDLTVFWYEGNEDFGQELYATASIALRELRGRLGAELEFPLRVIVYGNKDDFVSAFPRMRDWVVGRAFVSMGLTVQIIAPWDHDYMIDVIPHEITHLLFFQLTDNPYITRPTWLNEGLAVYCEWRDNSYYDFLVADAAAAGELLPMAFIVGGFPPERDQAILAYAQSYCMVKTIIEEFGWDQLALYLNAYKTAGLDFDEEVAFEEAFGLPFETFLGNWRESVGAPAVEPSMVPAADPSVVPTVEPSVVSAVDPTATPALTPTEEPTPSADEPAPTSWICLTPAVILLPAIVLWRRRQEERDGPTL